MKERFCSCFSNGHVCVCPRKGGSRSLAECLAEVPQPWKPKSLIPLKYNAVLSLHEGTAQSSQRDMFGRGSFSVLPSSRTRGNGHKLKDRIRVAQRSCEVSIHGGIRSMPECSLGQHAAADPTLRGLALDCLQRCLPTSAILSFLALAQHWEVGSAHLGGEARGVWGCCSTCAQCPEHVCLVQSGGVWRQLMPAGGCLLVYVLAGCDCLCLDQAWSAVAASECKDPSARVFLQNHKISRPSWDEGLQVCHLVQFLFLFHKPLRVGSDWDRWSWACLGSGRWVEDTMGKPLAVSRALVGAGREGVRISWPI